MLNLEIKELSFDVPENLEFKNKKELNKFIKELNLHSYSVEGTKLICNNIIVVTNNIVVKSILPINSSILRNKFSNLIVSLTKIEHKI